MQMDTIEVLVSPVVLEGQEQILQGGDAVPFEDHLLHIVQAVYSVSKSNIHGSQDMEPA